MCQSEVRERKIGTEIKHDIFIFYLPWYLWGQTSFTTIETFSTDKLHGLGKVQGSADVPAPMLGQRVASEPSALSTELCYRVLARVYGAQMR